MELAGVGLSELARLANTSRQNIDRLRKGQRKLTRQWAEKLAPLLGTSPDRLVFGGNSTESGVGGKRRKTLKRVPIGHEFQPDPDPDLVPTMGSETGQRGIPQGSVAQLDVTAGLGAGGLTVVNPGVPGRHGMTFAAEHIRDYWRLPEEIMVVLGLRASDLVVVPVQGDSMADTLVEGDYVFIDTRHRHPSPDGLYALNDDFGGAIIKRLEVYSPPRADDVMVRVISDNPRHAPRELPLSEITILGRVVRKYGVVA
jgi:hypothetical protein